MNERNSHQRCSSIYRVGTQTLVPQSLLRLPQIKEISDDEFWEILESEAVANPFASTSNSDEGLEKFWQWQSNLSEPIVEAVSRYGRCKRYGIGEDFNWTPPSDGSAVVVIDTERPELVTPDLVEDVSRAVQESTIAVLVNFQIEEFSSLLFRRDEILAHYNPHERDILQPIVDSVRNRGRTPPRTNKQVERNLHSRVCWRFGSLDCNPPLF